LAFGGLLLAVAALVMLTPGTSYARGGFHGAGFHAGGYHVGGYHGGYNFGGYHHGGYYHPYHAGYHHGYYRYRPYYGGSYGYYPYYDLYPNDSAHPDYCPDLSSGSVADSGYPSIYEPMSTTPADLTRGGSAVRGPDARAQVTVTVPADARLWFNGTQMTETGTVRDFQSPPLTPGERYTYNVRATWNVNGQEVTQTKRIEVRAGAQVNLAYPLPSTTKEPAAAAATP
jgi:uncharacterized protein (TIGR03000 family)